MLMKRIMGQQLKLTQNEQPPFYAQLDYGHTAALNAPFIVGDHIPCSVCRNTKRKQHTVQNGPYKGFTDIAGLAEDCGS